jgi:hypothetical protein
MSTAIGGHRPARARLTRNGSTAEFVAVPIRDAPKTSACDR